MSFANPTRLRIGMTGNFDGKEYRIEGRSVLGEVEDGETYYWNEFNLKSGSGEEATLVYDETDASAQWRMFTQFTPDYPMTAADAATKRVGDRLNLTGEDVRVTFRGSSCVYHVEGAAPEGEQVGSMAEYFNAESGGIMQVVSWTGDDVEYYNGVRLTAGMVASGFGIAQELGEGGGSAFSSFNRSSARDYSGVFKWVFGVGIALAFFFFFFGGDFSCSSTGQGAPVKKIAAGVPPLAVGSVGTVLEKKCHVTGHALVEIAEVGARWERHEYELADDSGGTALLICGAHPGGDWLYCEPYFPLLPTTANQAAAMKIGDVIAMDGYGGKVNEIFLETVEQTDGNDAGGPKTGTVFYGFCCTNDYRILIARWNNGGIQFFRCRSLPAKAAARSF